MKRGRKITQIISILLAVVICFCANINVMAAEDDSLSGQEKYDVPAEEKSDLCSERLRGPAPGLSSITITGLAVDNNNEIHIEVRVMGTAQSVLCWCNGMQCTENYNEMVDIYSGGTIVGAYRYFHTGIYYTSAVIGQTIYAQAQATNAMSPWNTLTTSRTMQIP